MLTLENNDLALGRFLSCVRPEGSVVPVGNGLVCCEDDRVTLTVSRERCIALLQNATITSVCHEARTPPPLLVHEERKRRALEVVQGTAVACWRTWDTHVQCTKTTENLILPSYTFGYHPNLALIQIS
ncbi:hypothetical protein B566_EDAN004610 [Ephemera danica]|nr:hypothetical protein B566_EDAN004610 [Ephemera danica]